MKVKFLKRFLIRLKWSYIPVRKVNACKPGSFMTRGWEDLQ